MDYDSATKVLAKYKYQIGVHNTANRLPDSSSARGDAERAELKAALNFLHRHPKGKEAK